MILANSNPSLSIKIDVGIPLKENFLAKVMEESKYKLKFFKDLEIQNLELYFDPPITLAKKFGLRGIPTTILFNKDGLEFARIVGSINFEDKEFIEWLSNFN